MSRLTLRIMFEPRDLWIGVYLSRTWWEMGCKFIDVYICIVPMLPIRLTVMLHEWEP